MSVIVAQVVMLILMANVSPVMDHVLKVSSEVRIKFYVVVLCLITLGSCSYQTLSAVTVCPSLDVSTTPIPARIITELSRPA